MLYVIENFYDVFCMVDYVRTFSAMKSRCEQFDYSKNSNNSSNSVKSLDKDDDDRRLSESPNNPQWKKEKEYDNDELFFGKDDDEVKKKILYLIFILFRIGINLIITETITF